MAASASVMLDRRREVLVQHNCCVATATFHHPNHQHDQIHIPDEGQAIKVWWRNKEQCVCVFLLLLLLVVCLFVCWPEAFID